MAPTMCEIDGRRPAVATVRIRQNGEERIDLQRLAPRRRSSGLTPSFLLVHIRTLASVFCRG